LADELDIYESSEDMEDEDDISALDAAFMRGYKKAVN